jgi:hypothetical protein
MKLWIQPQVAPDQFCIMSPIWIRYLIIPCLMLAEISTKDFCVYELESNCWICNPIHRHVNQKKLVTKASNRSKMGVERASALRVSNGFNKFTLLVFFEFINSLNT